MFQVFKINELVLCLLLVFLKPNKIAQGDTFNLYKIFRLIFLFCFIVKNTRVIYFVEPKGASAL